MVDVLPFENESAGASLAAAEPRPALLVAPE
jgi:hypothetical protein